MFSTDLNCILSQLNWKCLDSTGDGQFLQYSRDTFQDIFRATFQDTFQDCIESRPRSAGSFDEVFGGGGGVDNGAFSPEDPFGDPPNQPQAVPTYRPDILRTLLPQQHARGFDPGRLNVTDSSNAYRGFSNLGDISFGTRGLPTGFAEAAAKTDTGDSGIAESLAGINGLANTNLATFDLVDLGLTTAGYSRDRSRSPFTVSTVPRQVIEVP